jgi:hypothetical protein
MNLFTRNSPYYHLVKYLLLLLKHPVYVYIYMCVCVCVCVCLCVLYRVYLRCMDKFQEWISPYQKTETFFVIHCSQTLTFQRYRVQPPRSPKLSPCDFCVWGHFNSFSVFSFNLKWRDTWWIYLWLLLNHPQPHRDRSNGATLRDQTCLRVQWIRWRESGSFVVNCDLINNTKIC